MSVDATPRGVKNIFSSGSVFIDGILSGFAWSQKSIDYAFPDNPKSYSYNGYPDRGFNSISDLQRDMAMFALDRGFGNKANDGFSVEGFTNLKFSKGSDKSAEIRVAETRFETPTAWGFYPAAGSKGGDVWFGVQFEYRNAVAGTFAAATMLHELGHALGLKHGHQPGGNFGTIPFEWDSQEYSLMTYTNYIGDTGGAASYERYGAPQTYMMADIAALQFMYGADYSTNSGRTVYSWKPGGGETYVNGKVAIDPGANRIFATIWDGGGRDTYDLSAYKSDVTIDLAPGGFSKFSDKQLSDLGGGPNNGNARGNIFNALIHNNDRRSLIEDAKGGSGNDTIGGNTGQNRLYGNGGDDLLYGLAGDDLLVGGGGADRFYFAAGYGKDTVRDFQDGADLIYLSSSLGIFNAIQALSYASVSNGNVVFNFATGDTLILENVQPSEFSVADIIM
ncbi:MAG: M10 family metallopeptidase C-terminal domain-containing protein [Rhizobium sp.]|nr:M10 family metallopeptidase C-terminal domain-containing protein [Rhizobium sp.]